MLFLSKKSPISWKSCLLFFLDISSNTKHTQGEILHKSVEAASEIHGACVWGCHTICGEVCLVLQDVPSMQVFFTLVVEHRIAAL